MTQAHDGREHVASVDNDFFPTIRPWRIAGQQPALDVTELNQQLQASSATARLRGIAASLPPVVQLHLGACCLGQRNLASPAPAGSVLGPARGLGKPSTLTALTDWSNRIWRQTWNSCTELDADDEEPQQSSSGSVQRHSAASSGLLSAGTAIRFPPLHWSWPGNTIQAAIGGLVQVLTPLVVSGGGLALAAPGGMMIANCPFAFSFPSELDTVSLELLLPELSIAELECGIILTTFIQGSLGLLRICLGDVFNGCYSLLLATLGFNSRRPGPASSWLKTYVLITFINGTMGSVDLLQSMLLQNFPVILPTLPLAVNIIHAVQLVAPSVSFMGAFCGWQHLKIQRQWAREAYHRQLMAVVQQHPIPPWQLPGLPAAPVLPRALAPLEDRPAANTLAASSAATSNTAATLSGSPGRAPTPAGPQSRLERIEEEE
mmetsp:Transcript_55696/g.129702  ORF Transcript_55696/g.129702 Transcript_55696/m.129702 type:complete len:433 (-) Transcript_55696:104-1402(-)